VLLVGADGELPADPRHAKLLARRLLEYKDQTTINCAVTAAVERERVESSRHSVSSVIRSWSSTFLSWSTPVFSFRIDPLRSVSAVDAFDLAF
jgi:hypothetical protein